MTDKQKTLSEIRDDYLKDIGYKNDLTMKAIAEAEFKNGFETGVSEMKKRAQGLVDMLEPMVAVLNKEEHSRPLAKLIKQELEAYRKSTEGE